MIKNTRSVIVFPKSVPQQMYDSAGPSLEQIPEIETEHVNTTSEQLESGTYAGDTLRNNRGAFVQDEVARLAEISIEESDEITHTWNKLIIKVENTLTIPAKSELKLLIRVADNYGGLVQVVGTNALLLQSLVNTGKAVVKRHQRVCRSIANKFCGQTSKNTEECHYCYGKNH